MDRLTQVLTLDLLPHLGVYRLNKRLRNNTPWQLFSMNSSQLTAQGFSAAQISLLHSPPQHKITQINTWLLAKPQRKVISYYDDKYPALLKEISSPPMLLFCEGNDSLLDSIQLAIVGSRTATFTGRNNAKAIAQQLSANGITITSGLATGIDSCAHQGALAAKGSTIAVLGSGLDNIYPRSNHQLASAIIANRGLLLSEFWPDTTPYPANFPRRNRIVSGLSLGVIVVEAEARSGSLITARLAAEQNREVFAVPGCIDNPKTAGCHKLIHQGAKLITGIADILEELPCRLIREETVASKSSKDSTMSETNYDIVLACIEFEVTSIDQIVIESNQPIDLVLEQLLHLELAGLIASTSGGYIRLKGNHDV